MTVIAFTLYILIGAGAVGFTTGLHEQSPVTTYRKVGLFALFAALWPACAVFALGRLAARRAVAELEGDQEDGSEN